MQNDRYKQTVAPASNLVAVTVDEIKAHVALEGYDDYDNLLVSLRDHATDAVGKRCKRQILNSTWTLTLDGFPAEIEIDKVPVTSVTSVAYTDENGDAQTLVDGTDYQVDLSTFDGPARIKPIEGTTWPTTQTGTYGVVVITFQAGYLTRDAVLDTIKHEISMMAADWFRNRESDVVGLIVTKLPDGIEMLSSLNETGAYQ